MQCPAVTLVSENRHLYSIRFQSDADPLENSYVKCDDHNVSDRRTFFFSSELPFDSLNSVHKNREPRQRVVRGVNPQNNDDGRKDIL